MFVFVSRRLPFIDEVCTFGGRSVVFRFGRRFLLALKLPLFVVVVLDRAFLSRWMTNGI